MQVQGSNFQGSNTKLKYKGDIIWESTEIYHIFSHFFPCKLKLTLKNFWIIKLP